MTMTEIDKSLWPPTCHGRWMSEEYEPGLVSVIIPTYNRAHFLVEAMDSVWSQTYRPIELLVVDDGSTDNTAEVVEEWSKKCSSDVGFKLRYFHQENKGAPAARNLGLIESKGEYIQFWDSDDIMHRDKAQSQVAELSAGKSQVCSCQVATFRNSPTRSEFIWSYISAGDIAEGFLQGRNQWNTASLMLTRHVARDVGTWHEGLRRNQDMEYFARVALHVTKVANVEAPLSCRRCSDAEGRISNNYDEATAESMLTAWMSIRRNYDAHGKLGLASRRALSRQFMNVAVDLVNHGCVEGALAMGGEALRLSSLMRKPRLFAYCAFVKLFGDSRLPRFLESAWRFVAMWRRPGKTQQDRRRGAPK
jgi:glycosyltransferase involved in cell wall biosynthesis